MKRLVTTLLATLLLLAAPAYSAIEVYKFDNPQQEQRFQKLSHELRCLVCQNESLADSNADLARDLRREIHGMIIKGKTNDEIIKYMVSRYGDFVLFRPPLQATTYLLWFGPFLLIVVGLGALVVLVRKQNRKPPVALTDDERRRLDDVLSRGGSGSGPG